MHESRSVERLSGFRASDSHWRLRARGSSRGSSFGGRWRKITRSSHEIGRSAAAAGERTTGMHAHSDLRPTVAEETLLTASQVARRFSVSRNWVYQAVEQDRLPYRRLG